MAYDNGAWRASLAAAVGDDPVLIGELRTAYRESARRHFDSIAAARSEREWKAAALRLQSIAGSFGAAELMQLAEQAARSWQDRALIRKMDAIVRAI